MSIVWSNEKRKISDLIPAEYNPRHITEKQAKDLKASLDKFSLADPLVINADNKIIGGHQRYFILKAAGDIEVDVRVPNRQLTGDEEKELNIRLNKNLGEWDFEKLATFDVDFLKDIGFDGIEIDKIFGVEEDDFDAQAEYDQISDAVTKRGDLYQLGPHRLLCGDSTNVDDVARVMNGELADMVFTDPPYNVDYKYAKYEAIHKGRKRKFANGGKIFNDKKTSEEFYHFLLDVFSNLYAFSKPSMSIYVCHATKTQEEFFAAFKDAGFHYSQTIIWIKERIILALGQDYHRVYEPILFGWKAGETHYKNKTITTEKEVWDLDRMSFEERLDCWYIARDKSSDYVHPTQKPARLPERAIKKNCPTGGGVHIAGTILRKWFDSYCGTSAWPSMLWN